MAIASVFCDILYIVHARISQSNTLSFLPYNLFLAWIPFIAAVFAYAIQSKRVLFIWIMPICTLIWLIFFPNAPYLLTDLQHLADNNRGDPLWFDVITLIWFAWTGLLLGVTSLYLMQEMIRNRFNARLSWVFVIGVTILSSIGIFLGRFYQWNSWDLLRDPIPIMKVLVLIVLHPIGNLPSYLFTILFTLFFLFVYVSIHLFVRAVTEKN